MDSELTGLEHLSLMPVAPEQTRRAALYTAAQARSIDEAREFLQMLGLIDTPRPPKRKPGPPPMEFEHGTPSKYDQGCRCTDCTAAAAVRSREWRARQRQTPDAADRNGHGKDTTYKNYGCRCQPCTQAHADAWVAWSAGRKARTA